MSRVFGLTFSESDVLSKLVPDELGITLTKAMEMEPKFGELMETDPKIRQIMTIALRLEGLYRHAGIHAAGVIITSKPLVEYCPLFKGAKGPVKGPANSLADDRGHSKIGSRITRCQQSLSQSERVGKM